MQYLNFFGPGFFIRIWLEKELFEIWFHQLHFCQQRVHFWLRYFLLNFLKRILLSWIFYWILINHNFIFLSRILIILLIQRISTFFDLHRSILRLFYFGFFAFFSLFLIFRRNCGFLLNFCLRFIVSNIWMRANYIILILRLGNRFMAD